MISFPIRDALANHVFSLYKKNMRKIFFANVFGIPYQFAISIFFLLSFGVHFHIHAEPIVINGGMVPFLLGKPVDRLRCIDHRGNAIPFQIDEILPDESFVCPFGKEPNAGNGVLDSADEIVFLWEDADTIDTLERPAFTPNDTLKSKMSITDRVSIEHTSEKRFVYCVDDSSIPLSNIRYINYDEKTETISTPYYRSTFGRDRFHFVNAGVKDFSSDRFFDLANELRIKIRFHALWGLIPISYSENSIVCIVKRFKAGPIRMIRRGDFYLNLGFWIKGSHAAVNQFCYPDLVSVPVHVHLPGRFGSVFSRAYIEMTPVIAKNSGAFSFRVPQYDIVFRFDKNKDVDSIVPVNPNHNFMTVENGAIGYGWLLDASMQEAYLEGSGYVYRNPTERNGLCHCGFRLSLRDLPKGDYSITNWIVFSNNGAAAFALDNQAEWLKNTAAIAVGSSLEKHFNQLTKVKKHMKRRAF
jgi:hypothetical protein